MKFFEDFAYVLQMTLLTKIKILMSVLELNSKDRKSTGDKANISNPQVNRGCAPLRANRTSADCVQISLGPSIPYISLGVYHTGRFNASVAFLWLLLISKGKRLNQCTSMAMYLFNYENRPIGVCDTLWTIFVAFFRFLWYLLWFESETGKAGPTYGQRAIKWLLYYENRPTNLRRMFRTGIVAFCGPSCDLWCIPSVKRINHCTFMAKWLPCGLNQEKSTH